MSLRRDGSKRDVSRVLGWVGLGLAFAAGILLVYAWNTNDIGLQLKSLIAAEILWLLAGFVVLLTILVAGLTRPTGRGWAPALGAAGLMTVCVLLAVRMPVIDRGG